VFAQQLEDLRALPAARRLYEPPPKFASNAEARAWIMPRVCQLPLPMAQEVLDGVLSDTEFCKQKQRLAVGEDEVAPSRAACELFAEGANLLNYVLPGGEGDGSKVSYSAKVTLQLEGHRDCPQAQQRDDPLDAGPQGKCALRDAPHLRALHRMAAADSVVRFEGLELALDGGLLLLLLEFLLGEGEIPHRPIEVVAALGRLAGIALFELQPLLQRHELAARHGFQIW
jgi:hypothetical protein